MEFISKTSGEVLSFVEWHLEAQNWWIAIGV